MGSDTEPGQREHRIDIIRGLALLTILVNHATNAAAAAGMLGWGVITPTQLGYSSAAELFVFLSGYMVGLVYLKDESARTRLLKRAGTLYLYNLIVFMLVLLTMYLSQSELLNAFAGYDRDDGGLVSYTVAFLTFRDAPRLLAVLQLYIILLAATAFIVPLAQKRPWLLFLGSALLWLVVQSDSIVRDYSGDADLNKPVTFQPLAWQFIFVVGMLLGRVQFHKRLFVFFQDRLYLLIPIFVLLVLMAIHKVRYIMHLSGPVPWGGRNKLGGTLIAHSALILLFYCGLLSAFRHHLGNPAARLIAMLGRNTLNGFAASIVLTYLLAVIMIRHGNGYGLYLLLTGALIALVSCLAVLSDARTRRRKAMRSGRLVNLPS